MSQFDSLFKTDTKSKTETKPIAKTKTVTTAKKPKTSLSPVANKTAPQLKTSPEAKAEKRERGKSSNADYAQVLTYIKRDTHRAVKKALFDDLHQRDLSELVEELLTGWLEKNS
jgi:hypothetical protein